jgi:predicted RecB family nuclease
MRNVDDRLELSASDLANHLGCRHLTQLDLLVAKGILAPPRWRDPTLDLLQQRGLELELLYLDHLRGQGLSIAQAGEGEAGLDRTIAAMRDGADVVYQATLRSDRWHGRADFLRRVERRSRLGPWSYEVVDAKLARETRAGTILQLCLYSHMVGVIQGDPPEHMHVVTPGEKLRLETFRVQDFLAYHRLVQRRLAAATDATFEAPHTYPEPVSQCDICRWWPRCDRQRRDDDHLCLVAGISKLQINELQRRGVDRLAALAELPLPLEPPPTRGAVETYVRVREQARIQFEGRRAGVPRHETLPVTEGQGLCRLPEPSPGDIFLDFESDPFRHVRARISARLDHRTVRPAGVPYSLGVRSRHRARGVRGLHRPRDRAMAALPGPAHLSLCAV